MKKPPRSEAVQRFILFAATLGVITVILMGGSMMAGEVKQKDFNGEKISHDACAVMDKSMVPNRNGYEFNTFKVETSCGDFVTDSTIFETLNENEIYDLTTTAGNWANKPTVVSAEVASK